MSRGNPFASFLAHLIDPSAFMNDVWTKISHLQLLSVISVSLVALDELDGQVKNLVKVI
jgi:hypothetical protein